ncbi:hypothetical protein ACFO1B_36835 [Dactylosporangium siamense]|uniref:Uncharacterized protein n=1 Tax=Dactylosporangium siamense TaxID=685454 RepID=A0A919PSG3_9ACTN|nr:hypothetical protein [Dactylosporangium siamense]GIG49334.1 hypothetical protein Dsi01nite_073750 [Dactylosporangium siamense]
MSTEPGNTGPARNGPARNEPARNEPARNGPVDTLPFLDERLAGRLTDVAAAAPDRLGVTFEELRRRGARRRRTRIGVASAAVLLVAGGTTGGILSGALGAGLSGGSGNGSGGGATVGAPPATAGAAGRPSAGASSEGYPGYAVVGPVTTIDTGEAVAGGTLAIWFAVYDSRFVQAVGQRGPDGKLDLMGITNDPDVTGTGPGDVGFHAGWDVGSHPDRFFTGYVVGDVTAVTLTIDGVPTKAKVAAWPENPAVHAWWLRVPAVSPVDVRNLVATDAAGTVVASLPEGGVGPG